MTGLVRDHALQPTWTAIRPSIAYVAGVTALALAAPGFVLGSLDGLAVGLGFGAVGGWLLLLGRRLAKRTGGSVTVGGGVVTIHAPRVFRQDVVLREDELAEAIVDVEGVEAGADRLRFPASARAGERRFLHGRLMGSELFPIRPQRGQPNVALLFTQPRPLPHRVVGARDRAFPGLTLAAADPLALAADLRHARVAHPPIGGVIEVGDAEVVGSDRRPPTRGERTVAGAFVLATMVSCVLADGTLDEDGAGPAFVAAVAALVTSLGGLAMVGRRTRRRA